MVGQVNPLNSCTLTNPFGFQTLAAPQCREFHYTSFVSIEHRGDLVAHNLIYGSHWVNRKMRVFLSGGAFGVA